MYQFDEGVTTTSILRSDIVTTAADRLADALVIAGVAVFWGLLFYAAISLALI